MISTDEREYVHLLLGANGEEKHLFSPLKGYLISMFFLFFYQTLIGHPYFCYFSCLSLIQLQCCDLVATGLRP